MKKNLVYESLDEVLESKTDNKVEHIKTADIKKEKENAENNSKVTVQKSGRAADIQTKIDALEAKKKEILKNSYIKRTKAQTDADVKEIQNKIDAWKRKLA